MKKLFILFAALAFVLSASAQTATPKFYMNVTGHNGATPVTVDMSVYSDFHFVVNLPAAANSTLGANTADIKVQMTDVEGLGVEGTSTYTNTINTGVELQAVLSTKLSYAYGFNGASIPVTVTTDTTSKSFTYNIAAFADNQIIATPSNSDDAKAAWSVLMDQIEDGDNSGSSRFFFAKGSTFVLGRERLTFINDFTAASGASAFTSIFESSDVVIDSLVGAPANTMQFYLAPGSAIALGGRKATVKDNGAIKLDVQNSLDIDTRYYWSATRKAIAQAATGSKDKVAIHKFIELFNAVIGIVDNSEGLTVGTIQKNIALGDVNEDGSVDATDISILVDYHFDPSELPVPFNFWAADTNQDGIYDVTDPSALEEILFND